MTVNTNQITPVLDWLESNLGKGNVGKAGTPGAKTITIIADEAPNGVFTRDDNGARRLVNNGDVAARGLIFTHLTTDGKREVHKMLQAAKKAIEAAKTPLASIQNMRVGNMSSKHHQDYKTFESLQKQLSVVDALLENHSLQLPQTLGQHVRKEIAKLLPPFSLRSVIQTCTKVIPMGMVLAIGYGYGAGGFSTSFVHNVTK